MVATKPASSHGDPSCPLCLENQPLPLMQKINETVFALMNQQRLIIGQGALTREQWLITVSEWANG